MSRTSNSTVISTSAMRVPVGSSTLATSCARSASCSLRTHQSSVIVSRPAPTQLGIVLVITKPLFAPTSLAPSRETSLRTSFGLFWTETPWTCCQLWRLTLAMDRTPEPDQADDPAPPELEGSRQFASASQVVGQVLRYAEQFGRLGD